MQIGMIGLGRMGANMVRRLLRGGHECVVNDRNPEAVEALRRRRRNRRRIARWFYRETQAAARDLVDDTGRARRYDSRSSRHGVSCRRHHHRRRKLLLHRRHSSRARTQSERHSLRRRRNEWRRLGTRARLLPDDRRRKGRRYSSRSDLQNTRARDVMQFRRHPDARLMRALPRKVTCTVVQRAPVTS